MKSKNLKGGRNRIRKRERYVASKTRTNANEGQPFRRERRCRGLESLSRIILAAVALRGTSIGVAKAFSRMTTSNRRLPLAVAVRNGQRKRPWHGTQEEIETSLWHGFDRIRTRTPATSATRLQLFFNKRDEEGNLTKKGKTRWGKPTAEILNELRSSGISFPKEVKLDSSNANDVSLSLRYMTTDDLKALVPMCIQEFGSEQLNDIANGNNRRRSLLPRWILDPKQIPDLWEGFSFEMLIYWTLRLKLMQGGNSGHSNPKEQPKDPVMLVLCEKRQSDQRNTGLSLSWAPRVVGMVELSLQPPDADRNPPALPLPLWVKATLAKETTLDGSLQGWVTNLLICDSCRGRGYSKILMAAAEGIAQHKWRCSSVYLHADADAQSGKVPQSLYEGLGYDLVIGSTKKGKGDSNDDDNNNENLSAKFGWMGVTGKEMERFTAIRMVDGVALLCYSKQL
jgi:GNAT superfamily N-acetyltransferase